MQDLSSSAVSSDVECEFVVAVGQLFVSCQDIMATS